MDRKIKVFVLADHPLSPSGVAIQTKNMITALLETGKYSFYCFGGAIKHRDYSPQKIEPYDTDWIVQPIDGYGTQDMVRSVLRNNKPDILWFMTDPRFYGWLWEIEDEIRPLVPMVYYHVWDNYPYPHFNADFYNSTDVIASISKVTYDIVNTVAPDVKSVYIPHAVDPEHFKPFKQEDINKFREDQFGEDPENKPFRIFWNNRNARRKQSGTLIYWFKEFLDKVGRDKAKLLMHTDIKDPNGQDLLVIAQELGLTSGEVQFSQTKLAPEQMAVLYNTSDCVINISDAEGFGLATLEALSCGVPILVNMTGGLQEHVTDGEEWFGIGIEPSSKAIIGSQEVPYIYEDRLNKNDFLEALEKLYNMSEKERRELGLKGREHVLKNYSFEDYSKRWDELLTSVYEESGSWETRKNYKRWELLEV